MLENRIFVDNGQALFVDLLVIQCLTGRTQITILVLNDSCSQMMALSYNSKHYS